MIFFRFSKKIGFWVFLVHPTVVSVLLSARSRDALSPVCGIFFCTILLMNVTLSPFFHLFFSLVPKLKSNFLKYIEMLSNLFLYICLSKVKKEGILKNNLAVHIEKNDFL